jgi:ABC-type amino acid transport system permease subunit
MFFWYFGVPPFLPLGRAGLALRPRASSSGRASPHWASTAERAFSEVLRSGIQSIPKTQFEASVASGLTTFQAYRYVILPVALRLIIPPATNESLNLLKNSLGGVDHQCGRADVPDLARSKRIRRKAIEALTAGTVIYLVLCVSIAFRDELGGAGARPFRA